jgi:hypothetical protein
MKTYFKDGREFILLTSLKPPIHKRIMVDTFDNEVISVIPHDTGMGIDFVNKEDEIYLEEHEVKGWTLNFD